MTDEERKEYLGPSVEERIDGATWNSYLLVGQ
jgi:hypothetical protein